MAHREYAYYTPSPKERRNTSALTSHRKWMGLTELLWPQKFHREKKKWVKISWFYYAKVQDLKSTRAKWLKEWNLKIVRDVTYITYKTGED